MENETIIKDMIIDAWDRKVVQASKLFDALAKGPVDREVISGGNKVIYLIGHLVVASDKLFEVMVLGERLYPELDALFFIAQNPQHEYPSFDLLTHYWKTVNQQLDHHFQQLTIAEWLESPPFLANAKSTIDPGTNRLRILLSRSGHLAYHLGQLALTKHIEHHAYKGKIQTDCDYI